MGIFSSFLSRDQEYQTVEAAPAAVQPVLEDRPPDFPEICNEMPVEVVEKTGRVLNTGLITSHSGKEISMGRLPGGLSFKICEPGSTVYVRTFCRRYGISTGRADQVKPFWGPWDQLTLNPFNSLIGTFFTKLRARPKNFKEPFRAPAEAETAPCPSGRFMIH